MWYNDSRYDVSQAKGVVHMSESMLNMYISFAGMIFMFLAIGLIMFSRHKLKGLISGVVAVLAYIFMILAGIIIFYIVFSGPTS